MMPPPPHAVLRSCRPPFPRGQPGESVLTLAHAPTHSAKLSRRREDWQGRIETLKLNGHCSRPCVPLRLLLGNCIPVNHWRFGSHQPAADALVARFVGGPFNVKLT